MKTHRGLPLSRNWLPVGLVVALAVGLAGCGGGGGGDGGHHFTGGTGTITGVVDRSFPHANGVVVQLEGTDRQTSPDADGGFEFANVPVGEYTVAAIEAGQNLGVAVSVQVDPDRITHVGFLQLQPGGQIAGLVTTNDPETGDLKPVARARVVARPVGEVIDPAALVGNGEGGGSGEEGDEASILPPSFRVALTDVDGSYRMVGVAPGVYVIEVAHPDFEAAKGEFNVEVGRTTAADFTLQPLNPQELGAVEGKVTDPAGTPLGRVRVELFPSFLVERPEMPSPPMGPPDFDHGDPAFFPPRYGELVTYTDEQGQFAFQNVRPGRYQAIAAKRGYTVEGQEIEVKAGETTQVDFVLESRLVEVTGTVYGLKEDGTQEPLAGASVFAMEYPPLMRPGPHPEQPSRMHPQPGGHDDWPWPDDRVMTTTDENGKYTLQVTAGPTVLMVEKEGYQPARQYVEVDPNAPPTVDFVLHPWTPEPPPDPTPDPRLSLELSLSAAEFPAGEPVEMTLAVTNLTEETLRLTTPHPGYSDFAVYGQGQELWRWSHDKAFPAMVGELVLEPGESKEFTETWDQQTNEGHAVEPGEYVAVGFLATRPPQPSERVLFRVSE